MNPERFRRARKLFEVGRTLTQAERRAYLDEACAGDLELRTEVESLLAHHEDATDLLGESALAAALGELDLEEVTGGDGSVGRSHDTDIDRVGPFRILDKLGEGGMGVVYLAEQAEPVRRRVAVKVIKLGMDTREVIARFEAERQALALMDHPNIAKIFEAAATEDGRPYFVMEHVRGIAISEYSDRHRLSLRARLELLVQVCHAVQHAHLKGIIHRDLKPSNILVSTENKTPTAKIIDFGVAKATNQRLTEKTIYTELGCAVGTPAYMSPEQAETTAEDVDSRTDIYSLGVLLYELIVGEPPLDLDTSRAAYHEIVRRICEEEPAAPSARWSRLNPAKTSELAERRAATPTSLRGELRGDLDWITMKALEKDRERRYRTAAHLAEDVERHLRGETVLARAPTAVYRLRKFVRRNRGLVTAVSCVIVALAAGLVASLVLYARAVESAADARAEARRGRRLLYVGDMQQVAHVWRSEAGTARQVEELLDANVPEGDTEDLREFTWYYYRNLLETTGGRTLARRGEAAFTPTGQLVTVTGDAKILYWDASGHGVESHEELAVARERVLSPDGGFLAALTSAGQVQVTDVTTGRPVRTFDRGGTVYVAFSPAGRFLATFEADGRAVIREVATGNEVAGFDLDARYISYRSPATVTADGRSLLLANHQFATLEVRSLEGEPASFAHSSTVRSLALSPDGKALATGDSEGQVHLWSFENHTRIGKIAPHGDEVTALRFSRDGRKLATGGGEGFVTVWHADEDWKLRFRFKGHTERVVGLSFSPDGARLTSTSRDDSGILRARLWDLASQEESERLGAPSFTRDASYSPDGRWLALARNLKVELWSTRPYYVRREFPGVCYSVAFSPDSRSLATGSSEAQVTLWDVETGRERFTSRATNVAYLNLNTVASLAFSPDRKLLAAAYGNPLRFAGGFPAPATAVRVWALDSGEELRELDFRDSVPSLAFTPDSEYLATASHDGSVRLWDTVTWEDLPPLIDGKDPMVSVAVSPDGKTVVAGDRQGLVRVWSLPERQLIKELEGHADAVKSLAFYPGGSVLASGSQDRKVRLWDVRIGRELCALRDTNWIHRVAFSPDQRTLVSCSTDGARLWLTRPLLWDDPIEAAKVVSEELDRIGDWRIRAQLMEQVWERESVQRELVALRPADPLVHAARARYLRAHGANDSAVAAREKAQGLFRDMMEEPGATAPQAGVFAAFLANTSPWWTPLHVRSATTSSPRGVAIDAEGALRIPGDRGEKETYTVVVEPGFTRVTGTIVKVVRDASRLGLDADHSPKTMEFTGVALRARPSADAKAAQDVPSIDFRARGVALGEGLYWGIAPQKTLSLPEGAVLDIEFTLETPREEERSDLLLRVFATSEEELQSRYDLRGFLRDYPHPIHGWLALAAASSRAGESDRARAALARIHVEEFDGMELALLALTQHWLGSHDAARDWQDRLTEWLQQHDDRYVKHAAEAVSTWISR